MTKTDIILTCLSFTTVLGIFTTLVCLIAQWKLAGIIAISIGTASLILFYIIMLKRSEK